MLSARVIRALLWGLGVGTVGLFGVAAWEWRYGGDSGPNLALSAAVAGATFALAFVAAITVEQDQALVRAATDEARASADAARETRRQAQLASLPFLEFEMPLLGTSADESIGFEYLAIETHNLGPGPALELRLTVERQDASGEWRPSRFLGSRVPLVKQDQSVELHYNAHDDRTTHEAWMTGIAAQHDGKPPPKPPFIAKRLRLRFDYMSVVGATVEEVRVWDTVHIERRADEERWRLDEMIRDPGLGNGEPVVVAPPPDTPAQ